MSDSDIQRREEAIFDLARRIEDPTVRAAYLDQACDGDPHLQSRIDELVAINLADDSLLDRSPIVSHQTVTELNQPMENEGQSIGSYQLLQKLGEGGFGVVFMAEQTEPVRRKVALKIIKPGMESSDVIARFEAERQALALMNHPNIASVFDGGRTPSGRPFFVMELVRGVSITEYCDKKNLSPQQRIKLFMDVCSAIQHAHQKGVIHRDLKPSNVMITLHDGTPVVKVIDFGVAKAINQQLTDKMYFTRYGQMIGTPQYMSPEQAEMSGLGIDTLSDVYSLGVLLYELLVGTTPLRQEQLRDAGYQEMQRLICEVDPAIPSKRLSTTGQQELIDIADRRNVSPERLAEEIRGDLELIVMKTLSKERDRRYATPSDLSRDLDHFLSNEPVDARAPSVGYRFRKFVQRNRPAVIATAATTAALFIAGLTCLGLLIKEQRTSAEKDALLAKLEVAREDLSKVNEELTENNNKLSYQVYRTQIERAAFAIKEMEMKKARRMLAGCDEKYRDWEWDRLALKAKDQQTVVLGKHVPMFLHDDRLCLTVSPDGNDAVISFWNTETGEQGKQIRIVRSGEPVMNAISPDKSKVAVANAAGTVFLVDLNTGDQSSFETEHLDRIDGLNFTIDGKRLATASWDGFIKLWDTETGARIANKATSARLRGVATDPKGRYLATSTASSDQKQLNVARIWNADTLEPVTELRIEGITVSAVAFDATGELIAAGGGNRAHIWSTQSWEKQKSYSDESGYIRALQFRDNHPSILIGKKSEMVEWHFNDGESSSIASVPRQIFWATSSPSGRLIAYYQGSQVAIRGLSNKDAVLSDVGLNHTFDELLLTAQFTDDGKQLAVAGDERSITVFDLKGETPPQHYHGHQETVVSLAWDHQGRLYSIDGSGTLIGWKKDGQKAWSLKTVVHGASSFFHTIANIPNRTQIAVATQAEGVLIVDTTDGKILNKIPTAGGVRSVACDASGERLAWWDTSQQLTIYDLAKKQVTAPIKMNADEVRQLTFSPDSLRIAGVGKENCWIYDLEAGTMLWEIPTRANCWGVQFTNSGKRIIVSAGTKYDYAVILNAEDGTSLDFISTGDCFDFAYNRVDETCFFFGTSGFAKFVPTKEAASKRLSFAMSGNERMRSPYQMQRLSRNASLKVSDESNQEALQLAVDAVGLVSDCPEYDLTHAMALFRDKQFAEAEATLMRLDPDSWNNNATREDFPPARLEVIRLLFASMTSHALGEVEQSRAMLLQAEEQLASHADELLESLHEETVQYLKESTKELMADSAGER